MMMNNEGCERLSSAIIIQAVRDYMWAKRKDCGYKLAELKRFFRSDWFSVLTGIDGEWLIDMLDRKHEELMAEGKRFRWIDVRNI